MRTHDEEENRIVIEQRLENGCIVFEAKVIARIAFSDSFYFAKDCDIPPKEYIASYLSNNIREFVNSCRCYDFVCNGVDYVRSKSEVASFKLDNFKAKER